MTSPPDPGFTAIVLAAQRAGVLDPLAERAGVTHKCLVPIGGAALIAHVAAALQATPGLARLRIVVEPEAVPPVLRALAPGAVTPEFVPAAANLADSVHAAAAGVEGRMIVTTADNVLLSPDAVTAMLAALRAGADAAIAMANKASVMAAHPQGQRRYYRFADDDYSNCNLYGFGSGKAVAAAETFRGGGQFAKKPMRIVAAFGLLNLILLMTRRLSLAGALRRVGRRFRLTMVPVVLVDGAHAIDVDNARTYAAAEELLRARGTWVTTRLVPATA